MAGAGVGESGTCMCVWAASRVGLADGRLAKQEIVLHMAQSGWTNSPSGPLQAALTAAVRGRGSSSARLMLPGRAPLPSCRFNWTMQGPSQTAAKQVGAITDALGVTMFTWMPAIGMACCLPCVPLGNHRYQQSRLRPIAEVLSCVPEVQPGHGAVPPFTGW